MLITYIALWHKIFTLIRTKKKQNNNQKNRDYIAMRERIKNDV